MPDPKTNPDLFAGTVQRLALRVTLHGPAEAVQLTWVDFASGVTVADARIAPRVDRRSFPFCHLDWTLTQGGTSAHRLSLRHPNSIRSELNRLLRRFKAAETDVSVTLSRNELGADGQRHTRETTVRLPTDISAWLWIERQILGLGAARPAQLSTAAELPEGGAEPPLALPRGGEEEEPEVPLSGGLRITLNYRECAIELEWFKGAAPDPVPTPVASVRIRSKGENRLVWNLEDGAANEATETSLHRNGLRSQLRRLRARFPVEPENIWARSLREAERQSSRTIREKVQGWRGDESPWDWLEDEIANMGAQLQQRFKTPHIRPLVNPFNAGISAQLAKEAERVAKANQQREELLARIREGEERQRELQRQREEKRRARALNETAAKVSPPPPAPKTAPPAEVPVTLELPHLELQDTLLPLTDLRRYFLRERAALFWVSNQSDDLLALPYCEIQRLDYQIRTALRVIGPLRGRALLSDEVGLGKTIEAGLVLKEYLTRGMVKRFLVLTVPSLVDQWQEELAAKFHLPTATTNTAEARNDPGKFWSENTGIIASLHTLKQPTHLAVAQTISWDMLIIDEAHYLRNRTSQAWQAVNALPRQFLLLLTATPVQNSLEELYNLVTLLQPGQLPSPKEFRARFIDPKRPHQPREPDELRRLLGQVMIRNTRANAGVNLPPRRAETVLFEPAEEERIFWQGWELEFRQSLAQLSASQASLWGRLLLQTAGSSPAAWREALKSYPDRSAAMAWERQAPREGSWRKKCQLLEPLTKGEGGVVIFTQFLQTQAAIAAELRAAAVPTFVVNGQTPAAERQPITESFRQNGGALLLTHSGTEGRNLQFSHRLVNFDLPWNPMEIEQRIGRLHRLGQQHPVRIYNLVQAGTLQEHLLQILQEKLNLFELVVGETGLILGERFTSDEFAEEVLRRWRESDGNVAKAMEELGKELAAARDQYTEIKRLDETLFAKDYESL